jgi:hypothetical protein
LIKVTAGLAFLLFAISAYSQSSKQTDPGSALASNPSYAHQVRQAIDRLKQDLAEAPKRLGQRIQGNWSVLQWSLTKKKLDTTPLVAYVIFDYNPLSILKYYPSYRYHLRLELRHNVWELANVRRRPYFKDRPPRLETFNYRRISTIPPSRAEFKAFQSCFH